MRSSQLRKCKEKESKEQTIQCRGESWDEEGNYNAETRSIESSICFSENERNETWKGDEQECKLENKIVSEVVVNQKEKKCSRIKDITGRLIIN